MKNLHPRNFRRLSHTLKYILLTLPLLVFETSMAQFPLGNTDPNENWDTHIIPGTNGIFTYGTQAGVIDNNGVVYLAGQMLQNGNIIIKVISWDGSQWDEINGYLTDVPGNPILVNKIDVDTHGNIYLVGAFKEAYNSETSPSTPVLNVAKWDKASKSWSSIGAGVSAYNITAFEVDVNDNIYIGSTGIFQAFNFNGNNVSAHGIIKWDASTQSWNDMKGGLLRGVGPGVIVNDIYAEGTNVYVAGQFREATSASGSSLALDCFAKWDGSGWSMLGSFPSGVTPAYGLSVTVDHRGTIYYSSSDPEFILKYDGITWTDITQTNMGSGPLSSDANGMLYCQHTSKLLGGYAVSRYDGTQWQLIGKIHGYPSTFYGNKNLQGQGVYLGGRFNKMTNPSTNKTVYTNNNAHWDGTDWKGLANNLFKDIIFSMTLNKYESLFMGGNFTQLGPNTNTRHIAGIVNKELIALGKGVNDDVLALDAGKENFELFVFMGGEFTQADDLDGTTYPHANHVVAWDMQTKTYRPLGQGVNGKVNDIKYTHDLYFQKTYLLVGGEFTHATNSDGSIVNATNFAAFNLQTWQWEEIGNTNGPVNVIYCDKQTLYIGGSFTQVIGTNGKPISVNNIALQTQVQGIQQWWGLDLSFNDEVYAINAPRMFSFSEMQYLIVGGKFTAFTDHTGTVHQQSYFAEFYLSNSDLDEDGIFETPKADYSSNFGSKLNAPVHHITGRNSRDAFISGEFTEATMPDGTIRKLNHISRIRGVSYTNGIGAYNFTPLGDGTNNTVYEHDGVSLCSNMGVVAAGGFTLAGNQPATSIAKWKLNSYSSAIHVVTGTSPTSSSSTAASITYISNCRNPYEKKEAMLTKTQTQQGLPSGKFLMDTYSEFQMHFINFPDYTDTLVSFKNLHNSEDTLIYALVGLKDTADYATNPSGINRSLDLLATSLSTQSNTKGTAIVFLNTVTDSPPINILSETKDTLAKHIKYKDEARYFGLEARSYFLDFFNSETGALLYRDTVNFENLSGKVLVYFIKGFVDPLANKNGDLINGDMNDFNFFVKVPPSKIIEKRDQAITFHPISDKNVTDGSFQLDASTSFGLEVKYDVLFGNVTILGSRVYLNGPGYVRILATQEGNDSINEATAVFQSFCVTPEKPVLTLIGDSLLISSTSIGLQWYLNDALLPDEHNDTLIIQSNGRYKVSTSIGGCSTMSDEHGILTQDQPQNISNTAIHIRHINRRLFIETSTQDHIREIAIFDLKGMTHTIKPPLGTNQTWVEIDETLRGFFLVRVTSNTQVAIKRFVVFHK